MFTKKTFNVVNTDTPCHKKANACEKTFTKLLRSGFEKFADYETTSECQLCYFS